MKNTKLLPKRLNADRRLLIGIAVIFFITLLCRRPETLFHADFWAEDGWRWYPDAYNLGLKSLFVPYAGYLQTICRLVALGAQRFPVSFGPTIFAIVALSVQVTAATLLVSSRLDLMWSHRGARILFALMYVLLPNSFEVYGNLTNCQWHVALLGFLILVAEKPSTKLGQIIDSLFLLLAGLSGPFCFFLLPISLWQICRIAGRNENAKFAVLVVSCLVQLALTLNAGRGVPPTLGAEPRRFAAIFALQVILGPILGRHAMPAYLQNAWWLNSVIPVAVTLFGFGMTIVAFVSGPNLLRQFSLFTTLVFLAGLFRPATGSLIPAWVLFSHPDAGDRYYVFPMLSWIGAILTLSVSRFHWLRYAARLLVTMILFAIPGDIRFATRLGNSPPTDFNRVAKIFSSSPSGTSMAFPLRPEGVPAMVLIKH